MEFLVAPEVFERFPGMRIAVAVAAGVDNRGAPLALELRWRDAWREAREGYVHANAQSHPHVAPWRDRFRAIGVSGKDFPSSIEALLRRALKGGEPFHINPLVDFYNTVSLRHVVPVGGFDLDSLHGPLELRLTREGDLFAALDGDAETGVPQGEVAYADGPVILTRHFVWRQSRVGLIKPSTRHAFLVSEILGEVERGADPLPGGGGAGAGRSVAEEVLADLVAGLEGLFGVAPRPFLVTEASPTATW